MPTNLHQFSRILNIEKWQKLQDSLAIVTGLAIITVDYRGVPISKHSSRRPFCERVRSQEQLGKLCQKCDSRGGIEAVRLARPYIYICHCDIVDIAIPVIIENQYIGAIMAGEVMLPNQGSGPPLERIVHGPPSTLFESPDIQQLYQSIPTISYEKLTASVQMLFDLCEYLVEEATNKNFILNMHENISANGNAIVESNNMSIQSVQRIRHELGSAVTAAYIDSSSRQSTECSNKTLQPAFDYLYEHRNEMLSQRKAAALCHISTGHFSRLFTKETGESYSAFCSRLKIEWAKKLLKKTDISVSQISDELGFNEPSYFIKIFHRYEGITPAFFRKSEEMLTRAKHLK